MIRKRQGGIVTPARLARNDVRDRHPLGRVPWKGSPLAVVVGNRWHVGGFEFVLGEWEVGGGWVGMEEGGWGTPGEMPAHVKQSGGVVGVLTWFE